MSTETEGLATWGSPHPSPSRSRSPSFALPKQTHKGSNRKPSRCCRFRCVNSCCWPSMAGWDAAGPLQHTMAGPLLPTSPPSSDLRCSTLKTKGKPQKATLCLLLLFPGKHFHVEEADPVRFPAQGMRQEHGLKEQRSVLQQLTHPAPTSPSQRSSTRLTDAGTSGNFLRHHSQNYLQITRRDERF